MNMKYRNICVIHNLFQQYKGWLFLPIHQEQCGSVQGFLAGAAPHPLSPQVLSSRKSNLGVDLLWCSPRCGKNVTRAEEDEVPTCGAGCPHRDGHTQALLEHGSSHWAQWLRLHLLLAKHKKKSCSFSASIK